MGGIALSKPNLIGFKEHWKQRAQRLKSEVFALYFVYKDPRVPRYAKLFIILVVGYAFSPIDLIPDFIPILGYLDDIILIPLGVIIAMKMIVPNVMHEAREKVQSVKMKTKRSNWIAAIIIVSIWILGITWLLLFIIDRVEG